MKTLTIIAILAATSASAGEHNRPDHERDKPEHSQPDRPDHERETPDRPDHDRGDKPDHEHREAPQHEQHNYHQDKPQAPGQTSAEHERPTYWTCNGSIRMTLPAGSVADDARRECIKRIGGN